MKQRKIQSLFTLLLLLICLLISGCVAPISTTPTTTEPTAALPMNAAVVLFPVTLTDATGREFTFDAPPKIGCLWDACTEILADLQVIPYASDVPPGQQATFYFPLGGSSVVIADVNNVEEWAASGVELIVTIGPPRPEWEALEAAAPVFYIWWAGASGKTPLEEYIANLHTFATILGRQAEADAIVAEFERFRAALRAAAPANAVTTTVALIFAGDGYQVTPANEAFCNVVEADKFARCVGPDSYEEMEVNAEAFLAMNPDWIVYQAFGGESWRSRSDPVWSQLAAVQSSQIYDTGARYYCCSLRSLTFSLQEYASHAFGADVVPSPGDWKEFDPRQSALVQP